MEHEMTIQPLKAGETGNPEVDDFLRETEKGWILDPKFMAIYAHVPPGLLGWRRMIEGLVDTIGPVTWEIIAHRTAAVTGSGYETTHPDASVRSEVESLREALRGEEIDSSALDKRQYLAAALAEGVARHDVEKELFDEVKDTFATNELVGLCMAASLAHVVQLVADTLGTSPLSSN